jgi:hypothetical protein
MRFTTRKLAALAMTVGAALALARAASAAPLFVVVNDTRIGTFAVKADGSLAGAIRAYGRPRLRRTGEACIATWAQYGLTMSFYNLGGANPCTPRFGRFSRALMYGTRWRTDKGLRIGMSSKTIRRYYPRATFHRGLRFYWPSGWWLVTRQELFGEGGTYPGLLAATARGSLSSFQVRYPAGGD